MRKWENEKMGKWEKWEIGKLGNRENEKMRK